jgi:cardiolipin synthase
MQRFLKFAALVCLIVSCATIPQEKGAPGALSAEQGKALFDKLPQQDAAQPLVRHAIILERASSRPLLAGNAVQLLADGPATYKAMFDAVAKAKDHINLETYIYEDDEVGQWFAEELSPNRNRACR